MVIQVEAATLTIDTVAQFQLPVDAEDKADKLVEVLRAEEPEQAIVFVRTKIRCDQLYRTLRDRGMNVRALHGDMSQGSRDGVMIAFKGGRVPILVATDVAARGLDISTVTHVINFDVPTSPDVYVHRIGRTGRVGRSGRAITFVEPRQKRELEAIERHIGMSIATWVKGAVAAPTPVKERPRRHSKPRIRAATARSPASSSCSAAAAPAACASPTSSAPSPPRPGSTARPCATCACSSASRSCRYPPTRPTASSPRSTGRSFTATS